ncbi:MAG: hypothetical protein HFJ98_05675 [Eubacterium sp.]|nr:hypothetical protein [Eubacterium sp.]
MSITITSNIDEELEKLNKYKKLIEEINNIPMDIDIAKAVLTMDQVGKILHCSKRYAKQALEAEGAPMIKVGKTPLITATALYDHITKYGLGMK